MTETDSLVSAPIPQYYFLEITAHCNLRCPFCSTGNGEVPWSSRGNVAPETFKVLFDKIRPHAEVIDLFNWGEPFMHRRLYGFIEEIARAGIKAQISSNLTVRLFDERELERLVRSGLHSLLASIDGVTQSAYAAYRRGGNVQKALANLENIQKTKRRLGAATPHLTWGFYLNRYNEAEVDAARRKAEEIGVDIWFKELSCPPEFQTRLLAERPELFAPPANVTELWQPRVNRGLEPFELDPRLPKVCNVCRIPFEAMVINFNGDVYPCTAVVGEDLAVGNLVEQSLEEIWEQDMAENRRQLCNPDQARPASQCFHCPNFPDL